ncbi:3'-5' exonuclease [Flavilitoribacter nigricans]|uniref:3'-5' exonuclease n=1 Tax=Flavilitoribacter nigricans (strain ATCC 23147 / DSM 23189 / NBRC 102662 / NCIMB 1420 / SS-2) TaxID=1122177 RepID=A0A2D0ND35_FLAN2|nr:3'-5' exonuclease [Flavilitoribacter nigricans]PHN06421.1 3'-5' exonuclease [Flavilitoribacter nigricans DSM 23189 = NBRC 102662]
MIEQIDVGKVLFLDIETVSGVATYEELSEPMQALWRLKCRSILRQYDEEIDAETAAALFPEKAGIYAEFGKIVCISVGIVRRDKADKRLAIRLKSFADRNEKLLLEEFAKVVDEYYGNPNVYFLCGHNIKEFDIPYICRRMVVNQLALPFTLDLYGKKPWETKHLLDTMELWKFGDYKSYTSLKLLAAVLGFPSPKDDIDGSEVGRVFWEEDDLERIALYCEKDVLATAQLFLRYQRKPILEDDQIKHVS